MKNPCTLSPAQILALEGQYSCHACNCINTFGQSMRHEANHHRSRVFELGILAFAFQFQQDTMSGRFSMT